MALAACSTKRNTAQSRRWHAFNARFNTYFNGHEAFKEGIRQQDEGHKDDYTRLLPVFVVSREATAKAGTAHFGRAIEKCEKAIALHSIRKRPVLSAGKTRTPKVKAYLSRKEFNPFLKHAWLLMGQAQYRQGKFFEAASTFAYITRFYAAEPAVAAEARAWLARCYVEENWFYDAEDALARLGRDSLDSRLRRHRDATLADMAVRRGQLDEAARYVERTARATKERRQKARLYFLLAQLHQRCGEKALADKALRKCLGQAPPYELALNARILQTEVLAGAATGKKLTARLRRMARNASNKDYLDQIYYAMGNLYLEAGDTARAIGAYEAGREKSVRNGTEKGVLLLRLGGLYFDRRRFGHAQKCYSEALGLIDKAREDYETVKLRSKVLDELAPLTEAVYLQDSLQALARMPEAQRNAAIDRVIDALKKKEEEERRARADSAAEARLEAAGEDAAQGKPQQGKPAGTDAAAKGGWYFYNPVLVAQGRETFRRQWGKRKNEDDWRRANKTVVSLGSDAYDYEAEDSLAAVQDSLAATADSAAQAAPAGTADEDDPHQRAYYLAQIPFSDEQKAASDAIIRQSLFEAGVIEKDKLEDLPLAAETLGRIVRQYPDFEQMADVYYHLFLLYRRWPDEAEADRYRRLMAERYPDLPATRRINDPDFERLARHGLQIEDSLYTAAYEAYRRHDAATVGRLAALSAEKFADGPNRPKFVFVDILSRIGTTPPAELADELRGLVSAWPKSDVAELAGMIVKGLDEGRTLGESGISTDGLWERRAAAASADSTAAAQGFSDERHTPYVCLVAYPTGTIDDDRLLYDLAHFNFTTFVMRGFELAKQRDAALTQFSVGGFRTFEEAHAYAQRLFADEALAARLRQARLFIISEENLRLIGTAFSLSDYQAFYDRTFAPMDINPELPLDFEPDTPETRYEDTPPRPELGPGKKTAEPAQKTEEPAGEEDTDTGTEEGETYGDDSGDAPAEDDEGEPDDGGEAPEDDGEWIPE